MQANIPIPTDNLYKFLALFGLVLIVSGFAGLYLAYATTNAELVTIAERNYELTREQAPSRKEGMPIWTTLMADTVHEESKKGLYALLQKRVTIAVENRTIYLTVLSLMIGIGVALAIRGFTQWAKIQPLHDRLLELQVLKAEKEHAQSSETPPSPP